MFFKRQSYNYIVAGLGNPGPRFEKTRHNAGFMALDILAAEMGVKIDRLKFESLCADVKLGSSRVLLMKPQTYMNLSGRAVAAAARFYKLAPDKIIVISDDIALPVGALRVRPNGSAGGHNGLKSVIAELSGETFPRVKIGVGNDERYDMADWVTSKPTGSDLAAIEDAAKRAAEAVKIILAEGVEQAMGRCNGRGSRA